ncbi:11235_t:CDS:2 [Funneliformis caledonium]|uniref:11235_t:CDS:1 n=1 Tax=Funneliformis caledonium TaxID=1117310 RepID=A0A9N8VEU9_9GLOM|nr:11235_t:CDS:2 [Funneliformis caledonium]
MTQPKIARKSILVLVVLFIVILVASSNTASPVENQFESSLIYKRQNNGEQKSPEPKLPLKEPETKEPAKVNEDAKDPKQPSGNPKIPNDSTKTPLKDIDVKIPKEQTENDPIPKGPENVDNPINDNKKPENDNKKPENDDNKKPENPKNVKTPKNPKNNPAKDPKEPAKDPLKEPVNDPAKDPAKVKEPAKDPAKEPVKEPAKEPLKEPVTDPAKNPVKEPAKVPAKNPIIDPKAPKEPITKNPIQEPAKEPAKAPTKPVEEPPKDKDTPEVYTTITEMPAATPPPNSPKNPQLNNEKPKQMKTFTTFVSSTSVIPATKTRITTTNADGEETVMESTIPPRTVVVVKAIVTATPVSAELMEESSGTILDINKGLSFIFGSISSLFMLIA